MAISVQVPKDLSGIKTKVALNLTKRQIICFSGAAVAGIPLYFLTKGLIGTSAASLLMMGAMLPFFFFAMYEKNGFPAEKILYFMLRQKILTPGIRPYRSENLYKQLEEKEKLRREVRYLEEKAKGNVSTQIVKEEVPKEEVKVEKTQIKQNEIIENSKFIGNEVYDKNQEVLRKLQELKQKVLNETYGSKDNVTNLETEKDVEEVEKIDDEDSLKKVKEKEESKYDIPVQKISEPQVSESLNEEKYTYEPIKEDKQQTEQIQYKLPQKEEQTIQPVQNENIQEEKIEKENVEEKKTRFSPEFEEMYMKMFGTKPLEEQNKIEKEENNIDDITTPVENISIFLSAISVIVLSKIKSKSPFAC